GDTLGLGPAAIRRHLDDLVAQGKVERREPIFRGRRHRGRPAWEFALTAMGRSEFPHAYDDLAVAALRQLADVGGKEAVSKFANQRFARIEQRCEAAMAAAGSNRSARAHALAAVLTAEGYAAEVSEIASGDQLCQHHCPVAAVAAEFPQLCEAETAAISRLSQVHVQRLATIAHGDGVCTTHIPSKSHGSATTVPSGRKAS
ncbi:MAG: helix-turn-helix transcriptional regulator, partial [Mycobacteriales bacterium]